MRSGPRLYSITQPFDGRLAISARPMGWPELDDDVAGWRAQGVDVIVSMMEREEAEDLGLSNEGFTCREHGIEFIGCAVPDHGVPQDMAALIGNIDQVLEHLAAGKRVAAHCFAGMGRSPLFVASVMICHGVDVDLVWQRINAARGLQLPETDAQWQWVAELADRQRAPGKR